MNFRTEIHIPPENIGIDYRSSGLVVGSCFAAHIGSRMSSLLMPVTVNPMGIMFNPASVAASLEMMNSGYLFTENDLRRSGGLWVSFSHHGSFSSPDALRALEMMNKGAQEGAKALKEAKYVIITFGTAWIYEHQGQVVANCHKFPAEEFSRRRMEPEEIAGLFAEPLETYLKDKKVIFTVSPVRHIKDGLGENSLSKAILRVGAARLCEKYANCSYFPSYEILTDDLRDYRFYDRDMVHPSPLAVDYVWEKFCGYGVTPQAQKIISGIEPLVAAAAHRPLNPQSGEYARFRTKMAEKCAAFKKQYPFIDISEVEKAFV